MNQLNKKYLIIYRIILFLNLILTTSVSFAQDYQPMLVEGNYWDTGYYNHDNNLWPTEPEKRYVLGSDINVNGTIYKQIEIHSIVGVENPSYTAAPFYVESNYTISNKYIREDIAEKKVYIWGDIFDNGVYQEYLLYDFNLEVGDTLINPYSDEDNWIVDHIYINNGIKAYDLNNGMYSYIEGVGGSAGIISQFIPQFEYYELLLCHGNYNTAVNNCEAVASINNNLINNNINIYPNPATKTIFLDVDSKVNFVIYSLDGKAILKGDVKNKIDISDLNTGFYFLKLKNNNVSITKKIVVK